MSRNRNKILLTLNKKTLNKLDYISNNLFLSKGVIIDELVEYILKKELSSVSKKEPRFNLTTTVNPYLWNKLKEYANNNFKSNHLIELAISKHYRHYFRRIKKINKD